MRPQTSAPVEGTLLAGRYRLVEEIGRGGMSVVWRAHDEVLDRRVAVKILGTSDDVGLRMRLRDEARAAGRLTAPGIAAIYDYGEAPAARGVLPYLVMEFVDGQPLSRRLAGRTTLPWRAAAEIGARIAEALTVAHAEGLVHRDIKPDNVVLTSGGIKLIDFGISASIGAPDADNDGRLLGTAAYTAPERLSGLAVGSAADVYALGVLLYRALTGTLPWVAETKTELLEAHLFVDPTPLPADLIPAALAYLISTCLDKEPAHRPTSAELAGSLTGIAAAEGPDDAVAPSASGVPELHGTRLLTMPIVEHRQSSRRSRVAVVGGLLALALIGTGWAALHRPAHVTASNPTSTSCRAAFAVTRDWGTGFTAALTITNDTSVAVQPWHLAFAFPGDQSIDTSASGRPTVTLQQTGASVSAEGTFAAAALAPHESVVLPITASYAHANPIPTVFRLNGTTCRATVAVPVSPSAVATTPPPTGNGTPNGNGKGGNGNGRDGGGKGKGKSGGSGAGGDGGGNGGGKGKSGN